ncbi:MAG TPA: type II secretion system F family protein [Phycisphaerae bacterium]|nr:type II secretion system F family protein [Phycisphaerae bacterium]HNU46635.1 type II secretion system F family protein [Phycisphaerae bacterium]
MATFTYIARDPQGNSLRGQLAAATPAEAARLLRREGKFPIELKEHAAAPVETAPGSRRVRKVEVIYFATQMAVMVETGVPIADALDGIIRQTDPGAFRRVLTDLLERVEAGTPLSEALARHRKVFTPLFINLVRASEMSGRLGETLGHIAAYLTRQREIASKVRGAFVYPIILVLMSVGMVVFLMTYLLPKFLVIYRGRTALLPTPTRILIVVSDALTGYWAFWLGGLLLLTGAAILFLRTASGRRTRDWLALHLPLVGRMFHKALITRALHTLGTLIDSGVSVLDAVAITKRITGNQYFAELWDKVDADLQRGQQLSGPLYGSALFPRPVVQMIEAGERSGSVGPVMKRICAFMEEDLNTSIQHTTRLIEPIMIVILGSVVGAIAIALLLPIFTMSKIVGH